MLSDLSHRRRALRQRILLCAIVAALTFSLPLLQRLTADLVGAGAPVTTPSTWIPVCGPAPELFPPGEEDKWDALFRARVKEVLAAYSPKVDCTGEGELGKDDALSKLAAALPAWGGDPVHDTDLAAVLLEYLDQYGCSLRAQTDEIVNQVRGDVRAASSEGQQRSSTVANAWNTVTEEIRRRGDERQAKLDASREVMQRVLMLIVNMDKLRPLDDTFVCLNRTSKDLRNVLGLLADGSACVSTKTWDAKTPLRDLSSIPGQ